MAQLTFSGLGALATSGMGLGPTLGWFAGGLLSSPFQKKPLLEGPRAKDTSVQSAAYGMPIPLVYGVQKMAGNIIWSSGIAETMQKKRKYIGGRHIKMKIYHYHTNLAIALCEGEIDQVLRIWADDELIYDAASLGGKRQGNKNPFKVRIYKGTESQMSDSLIAAAEGTSRTPAFKGLAYVVFENFCLDEYHGRVPHFSFEIATKADPQFGAEKWYGQGIQNDGHFLSPCGKFLYAVSGTNLLKISRQTNQCLLEKNYAEGAFKSGHFQGRILYDREQSVFYSVIACGNRASLMVVDAETLEVKKAHEMGANFLPMGHFGSVIVLTHATKGTLAFYDKISLEPLVSDIKPKYETGFGFMFTNAVCDSVGRLWVLTNHTKKADLFYALRLGPDGEFDLFKIEGYGKGMGVVFDGPSQDLFIIAQKGVVRLDQESANVKGFLPLTLEVPYVYSTYSAQEKTYGSLYVFDAYTIYTINLHTLSITKTYKGKSWNTLFSGLMVDETNDCFWNVRQGVHKLYLSAYAPRPMVLKDVLVDMCRRLNIETISFEKHGVFDQPLYGLVLQGHEKMKHVLQMLMAVYQIQMREQDGGLYFFSLHQKPKCVLESDKLGAYAEKYHGESDINITFKGDDEQLSHLSLIYQSLDGGYEYRVAEISSDEHQKGHQKVISLSLLLPDDHAAQLGLNIFERENSEGSLVNLQLPPFYSNLDAGDVVAFMDNTYMRYMRFEEITLGANGLLKVSGKLLTHLEPSCFKALDIQAFYEAIAECHLKEVFALHGFVGLTLEGKGAFEGALLMQDDEELNVFNAYAAMGKVVAFDEHGITVEFCSKPVSEYEKLVTEKGVYDLHHIGVLENGHVRISLENHDFVLDQKVYIGAEEAFVEIEKPSGTELFVVLSGHDVDDGISVTV